MLPKPRVPWRSSKASHAPHSAGTHSHRPPQRDRRPPTQKLADVPEELGLSRVRIRRLQRNAEDALLRYTFVPDGS